MSDNLPCLHCSTETVKVRHFMSGQCPAGRSAPAVPVPNTPPVPLVSVESPYAGDVERNERYARACMRDCIEKGEAPIASHLLYTQPGILDDKDPTERRLGMHCGFAWNRMASKTVVYVDLGITDGMKAGVERADKDGREVVCRQLGTDWEYAFAPKAPEGVTAPASPVPPAPPLTWTKEKEEAYDAMEKAIMAVRMWVKAKDQTHMDNAMLFTRWAMDALTKVQTPEPQAQPIPPEAGAT